MKYRTKQKNITKEESKEIKKLYNAGMRVCDIARKLNIRTDSIYYHTWSKEKRECWLDNQRKRKRKRTYSVIRDKKLIY